MGSPWLARKSNINNTIRVQIRKAIYSNQTTPGNSVIAEIHVEVSQWNNGVPLRTLFKVYNKAEYPDLLSGAKAQSVRVLPPITIKRREGGDPLVHQGILSCSSGGLWVSPHLPGTSHLEQLWRQIESNPEFGSIADVVCLTASTSRPAQALAPSPKHCLGDIVAL